MVIEGKMDNIKTSLLIVDDDEGTLKELSRILNNHTNFEILCKSTPSEALKLLEGKKIDMALLDLKLPEMSGLDLVSLLKNKNEDILITIMTGYGEEETPTVAKESGVVDFIEKPLNLQYLLATLRFQEREVSVRRALRSTADLLTKFFSITDDGIVMEDGSRIIVSNKLGEELYSKFKDSDEKKIKDNGRLYEKLLSRSGTITFYHFKDVTSASEISKSETQVQMAKMLSHELHNSLTPVKLWLQEILSLEDGEAGFAETAKKAAKEGILQIERLVNLTRKFKDISKDKVSKIEDVTIYPLLKKLLLSLEPIVKAKNITVEIDLDENLMVKAAEQELYHVFYNLILNSIEAFKSNGGKIKVSGEEKESVLIRIEDNAGGLPQQIKENPFSAYLTTKENGTGLGLVLSKEMISKMEGELSLKSKDGFGVTVEIKLPKVK